MGEDAVQNQGVLIDQRNSYVTNKSAIYFGNQHGNSIPVWEDHKRDQRLEKHHPVKLKKGKLVVTVDYVL